MRSIKCDILYRYFWQISISFCFGLHYKIPRFIDKLCVALQLIHEGIHFKYMRS